jgi:hypothetical protein
MFRAEHGDGVSVRDWVNGFLRGKNDHANECH